MPFFSQLIMTTNALQSRFVITIDDTDDDLTHSPRSSSSHEPHNDSDPEVQLVCMATPLSPSADLSDIEVVYQRRATDKQSILSDKQSILLDKPVVLSEDIAVIGERNTIRPTSFYSHFWHMCSESTPCDKCYCFICDIPVNLCTDWTNHKQAIDTRVWQNLRATFQKRRSKAGAATSQLQGLRRFGNDCTNTT